jgi:hypothetical protein
MKKSLYILHKKEFDDFMDIVLFNRRIAHEMLNHFLVVKQPDDWSSLYAALCEYIAIAYRFQELLETLPLDDGWSEEEQCWYLEEATAASVGIFATSEISCRHELSNHNISLFLH